MTRALLCSVLVLSLASCSSSDNSDGSGGSSATGGSGGTNSQGGATNHAGSAGTNTTGGTGAGGSAGNAGSTAGGGTGGTSNAGAGGASGGTGPSADTSVTQRGGDNARTSHWVHSSLTNANMAKMALDTNFKANFTGELTGTPLFLAGATPGTGRFFVATTENDLYALDETTGAPVWTKPHNIGGYLDYAPICGSDPKDHGIVSTPVIDAAAHKIFLAAAMTDGHHEIHALSTDTGDEVSGGWPVDVSKINNFPSDVQNQRSALSLVNGILYVAFGGYCGDAGAYHGWVVAVNSADPTKVGSWSTLHQQEGIWAAGGLASDGNGVFAVTGNAGGVSGDHSKSDSEEIIRITDMATPHRDTANLFFPTEWATPMNSKDLDFGSCSPAVVSVPNAKPSTIIVAPAKPGRVYFLDAGNLGGSLGQFADMAVADTNSQTLYTTPSAYTAASGVHVAFSTGAGSQCPNGNSDNNVMSILLKPSAPGQAPMPSKAWCAPIGGGDTPKRSPISTNSSGSNDPIVWYMNGSNLNGFNGEDGTVLFGSSKGGSSCGGVHKFTSLIAVGGRIVAGGDVGGQGHLCSWSVH